LGVSVFPSVAALPIAPDLALVCTPAATVPAVLEQCGAKGVGGAIVLAVGASRGTDDPLEASIRAVTRATGLRVIGPNTAGFSNFPLGLNLVGVPDIRPGRLAVLMQSGNVALALLQEAMTDSAIGISTYVGVGNEVDVGFDECLDYFGQDPDTDAVAMYVEGFRNGRRFVDVARRVTASKPVVLLKGGRSPEGGAAVGSHTGAVAGAYPVFREAMRQAGIIEVDRSDELFAAAATLVGPGLEPGRGVAVLADGGGHATIAVDLLSAAGVPLAALSDATTGAMRLLAGDAAAVANPIDLAGAPDQDPSVFVRALEILLEDAPVGGVLVTGLFGGYHIRFDKSLLGAETDAARQMVMGVAHWRKPVIMHTLYGTSPSEPLDVLRQAGIPVLRSLEIACRCVAALDQRAQNLSPATSPGTASVQSHSRAPHRAAAPAAAPPIPRRLLLEPEVRDLLAPRGVSLVPAKFCRTTDEVREAARTFGGPVALKAVSRFLAHKSDAGGVRLNLPDADAAVRAYHEMLESVRRHLADRGAPPDVEGALVSPMLAPPIAELLVGVRRDLQFGLVLVVGAGGIGVELAEDVAIRLPPVSAGDVLAALDELAIAPILRGHRGQACVDREAIARLALGLVACADANPALDDIEINPVFAYTGQAVAVDVRGFARERA
jgi:acetyltransferase